MLLEIVTSGLKERAKDLAAAMATSALTAVATAAGAAAWEAAKSRWEKTGEWKTVE